MLGVPVKLSPAEEMIWSKSMIMERERYDGADVAHLLRHCSGLLNWDRLVRRFGPHWRILLSHLVLFGFIYPGERSLVPSAVIKELVNRLLAELDVPTRDSKVCQGTLLSRAQYLVDVDEWGYEDARLAAARIDDRRTDRGVDRGDRQVERLTERSAQAGARHDHFLRGRCRGRHPSRQHLRPQRVVPRRADS